MDNKKIVYLYPFAYKYLSISDKHKSHIDRIEWEWFLKKGSKPSNFIIFKVAFKNKLITKDEYISTMKWLKMAEDFEDMDVFFASFSARFHIDNNIDPDDAIKNMNTRKGMIGRIFDAIFYMICFVLSIWGFGYIIYDVMVAKF